MISLKENLPTGKLKAYKEYQLEGYSSFTTNTKGALCIQKKAGRHKQPLPKQVKYEIIKFYKMYRANASYIGKILRAKGYSIDNNRIKEAVQWGSLKSGTERNWQGMKVNAQIHCNTLIGTK